MMRRMDPRAGVGVASVVALAGLILAVSPNTAQAHTCRAGTVWTKYCAKQVDVTKDNLGHCGVWKWACLPPVKPPP
jgi:hypothetical protein